MERSIRIGKDFNVRWSINKVVDGERQPYELAGKELVLQYRTPYGLKEATEWKVVGNTIVWTFRGKEQNDKGSYELVLTENGGKDGMVTVDTCRAFKLVAHSCEETEGSGSDIVIEDVVLESEVAFAALRGPQGEQGPAGPSYDDTEIKGKLAELSEELASNGVLIEDLQNTKIEKENDDYYPKMAVGLADNLAGVDVVDSEINFRRSGGGAITDGVARIETIKGNSVVWNQSIDNTLSIGKFKSGDNSKATLSVTSNGFRLTCNVNDSMYAFYRTTEFINSLVVGHKYLRIADINSSVANGTNLYFRIYGITGDTSFQYASNVKGVCHAIFTVSEITMTSPYLQISAQGCKVGDYVEFSQVRLIDLTKMFGSGNEPTTIEEFNARKPLNIDEYAYNEGEVIHMNVQSIESVGVNQWDEEWELGQIRNVTGEPMPSSEHIRSKNYIPVIAGATYYCLGTFAIIYYDGNLKQVDWWSVGGYRTLTLPQNVHYVKLYTTGTTYKGDICINLSDAAINGKYFPYIKRQEDLGLVRKYFPDGMKSAGTAHDEIRYNKASGKWEKVVRIGEIGFSGAKEYTTVENTFLLPIADMKAPTDTAERGTGLLCAKYPMHGGVDGYNVAAMSDKSMLRMGNGNIYIKDSAFGSDATAFKNAMDGVMLYYELAEPIVTELDEADQFKDLDYQVWNGGTEKANAEGKSAPLAADITYGFNAIGKIKELESLVAALRAKVGI